MPGVKCNELKRKLSATLEGAAGREARFLSVMVGAYQLMSRTFAAHQIKKKTWNTNVEAQRTDNCLSD